MLGPRVSKDAAQGSSEELMDRIGARGRVMVVNDV